MGIPQDGSGSSPPLPPVPPPPPPTTKRSYAAASSSPVQTRSPPHPLPPPVPPKPAGLQSVPSSNFFGSSPIPVSSAAAGVPPSASPPALSNRTGLSGAGQAPVSQRLHAGASADDSDDPLGMTSAPAPAPAGTSHHRAPRVTRTYGSNTSPPTRRERAAGRESRWDVAPEPVGAASNPTSPSADTTATTGGDGARNVWGVPAWQTSADSTFLEDDTHDVRIVPASPSPPPAEAPPSPTAPPRLLEWPGPAAQTQNPVSMPFEVWWTTPRVLASPGELAGGRQGIWEHKVWDFAIADTPEGEAVSKGLTYRAMGEWVSFFEADPVDATATASSAGTDASAGAAQEDVTMVVAALEERPLPPVEMDGESTATQQATTPPALPPKPIRGFHTIDRADLAAVRPHPNLYFCPRTFFWALFAPLVSSTASSLSADSPTLWHIGDTCLPMHLSRYFSERLLAVGQLPPPDLPIRPARPDLFSKELDPRAEANSDRFEDALGGLVELHSGLGQGAAPGAADRPVVSVSGTAFYPAVIPPALWERMLRERGGSPPVDLTPDEARWQAARCIWRAINNILFAGETRGLSAQGKHMSKVMPFDALTHDIFVATLGFRFFPSDASLRAPHIDKADANGRENRQRLLRCWLEIGIWLEDFAQQHAASGVQPPRTRIALKSAKPALQAAMGGDDLPRVPQGGGWSTVTSARAVSTAANSDQDALASDYDLLGLTPDLTDSVIASVYDQQVERDSSRCPVFLEALIRISKVRDSSALQEKVAIERSLDRYPASEVVAAFQELRLKNPFEQWISEEQVIDAFDKRNSQVEHRERRKVLFEQAKVVANFTGNEVLKAMLESMGDEIVAVGAAGPVVKPKMDLDAAKRALGIESDVDDGTIGTLYGIRLEDASNDAEKVKMREALEVIAEARDSAELRTLALTGKRGDDDGTAGWEAGPTVDKDMPVGLTNIANTCYLNSLLQYFFTVRELRDTILAFQDVPTPPSQQAQLRVGGRLVSPAEVKRSKRFVTFLQTLYQQLIHAPVTAVTPETELAYLALVPSREEAEASVAPAASAALTEEPEPLATLNTEEDDKLAEAATSNELRSPTSVLGKRKVGEEGPPSPTAISDTPMDSQQTPPSSPSLVSGASRMTGLPPNLTSASPAAGPSEDADMTEVLSEAVVARQNKRGKSEEHRSSTAGAPDTPAALPAESADEPMLLDVEDAARRQEQPPPLPPRPPPLALSPSPTAHTVRDKERELERQVSSYMAFGRQNDVSECMDNVMFQVEAALLANAPTGQAHETASLLRRTFYGTMRQQIVFDDPASVPDPVRTQDEPFSSLLVDVAPSASSSGSGVLARDIYDGLDAVFAPSPITLEGQAAQRWVALVAPPPPVLQIQLQRVQYDREKQTVYKSNAHLQFYEEIGVGRYIEVEEGDEPGKARMQTTQELRRVLDRTRSRLAELTKDKNTNTATVLRSTANHFAQLMASRTADDPTSSMPGSLSRLFDQDSTLLSDTELEAACLEQEVEALRTRIGELRDQIKAVWDSVEDGTRYELTAVFIHRGTALSGHYYIYQRDHRNPQRWLRYNDSVVSEVDKDEVFRETTGDTNAYFLAYVRTDCGDAIESIRRE